MSTNKCLIQSCTREECQEHCPCDCHYCIYKVEPKEEVGDYPKCKNCNIGACLGCHIPPLEVKERCAGKIPNGVGKALNIKCGCSSILEMMKGENNICEMHKEVKEGSKDIEWLEEPLHISAEALLKCSLRTKDLLSQQEAKIKRELVEKIDKYANKDWDDYCIEGAKDDIKKLLSE